MSFSHPPNGGSGRLENRIFSTRWGLVLGLGFAPAILVANRAVRFVHAHGVAFDCPPYWPLGQAEPRWPRPAVLPVFAACLLGLPRIVRWLERCRYRLPHVIGAGLCLVLATNLLQGWTGGYGWNAGFVQPVAGGDPPIQYYHDAVEIEDVAAFLRDYDLRQPHLREHGRTHPPGAVLLILALLAVLSNPGWVAVAIAVASVVLTAVLTRRLLSRHLPDDRLAGYATFLLLLVPAVQIYYCASVDALIAALFLGVVCYLTDRPTVAHLVAALVCLMVLSMLTFAAVLVLPVVVGNALLRHPADSGQRHGGRRLRIGAAWPAGAVLAAAVVAYVALDRFAGFNYVRSFRVAAALENPDGLRLLADPISYAFTRVENVAEIAVFFGPFLTVLAARGLWIERPGTGGLNQLTWLAVGTLAAAFVTGAFHTGETARACLFIYPCLVIPVAGYLGSIDVTATERRGLLRLVFVQTLLMQVFGMYFW